MNVLILGGGAFGTALAVNLASNGQTNGQADAVSQSHAITLWVRDPAQLSVLAATRENARYLPGVQLPASLHLCSGKLSELGPQIQSSDAIIVATPVAGLRDTLNALGTAAPPVAWLCKGFEPPASAAYGLLPHEIHAQISSGPSAVISGPSFAQEVARGAPSALVAASADAGVRQLFVDILHNPTLRVYASDDVVGVEVGGAVKNVLAIATGLCDGLQLGLNARAALITRGLAEMTRLGVALGGRSETFMGLSGLGDLVLTATGDLSRNRKVGLMLASGKTLAETVESLGHVAEGVYCARTVAQRAALLGIDMPITDSVVALLDGQSSPQRVVRHLMGREPKFEAL